MLEAVRAVVFDLDGTLLDRRRSFDSFVRHQWLRFQPRLHPIDRDEFVRSAIEHDGDGYKSRKRLFVDVLTPFGLPVELADELLRDYKAGFPEACVLFPDARPTLSALRAGGVTLGLVTNGSARMQTGKLRCLDLMPAFDAVVISEVEGVHKPNPAIFHLALERLGVEADEAVFVGDHPQVDIAGARAAGLRAVWRRDPRTLDTVDADATIDNVSDVLGLVSRA